MKCHKLLSISKSAAANENNHHKLNLIKPLLLYNIRIDYSNLNLNIKHIKNLRD